MDVLANFDNIFKYSIKIPAISNLIKFSSLTQCADGESNKIVYDKKKTVTEWMFNTYGIRNYFVPNPVNSKLIRLKKNFKKLKSKN